MRIEFGRTALEYHPTEKIDNALVDRLFKLEESHSARLEQRETDKKADNDKVNGLILQLIQQLTPLLGGLFKSSRGTDPTITVNPSSSEDGPPSH